MNEIERLADCGTATVFEASGGRGLIDIELVRLTPGARVAGPARTVLCAPADNLGVHEVLEGIVAGEVVVITTPEPAPVALVGELLALQAHTRGAAALLVDGAVRDTEAIVGLGLPVWCRWVRAAGATKRSHGALGVAVRIGGAVIEPGDIVVLDGDGAVVVPRAQLAETTEASVRREHKEDDIRARLREGALTLDLLGLREVG